MKVGKSAETYQVGAHFKALIKAILVAPSRTLEKFFSFHVSLPRCGGTQIFATWQFGDFFGWANYLQKDQRREVKSS